jgi:hypothetical protein
MVNIESLAAVIVKAGCVPILWERWLALAGENEIFEREAPATTLSRHDQSFPNLGTSTSSRRRFWDRGLQEALGHSRVTRSRPLPGNLKCESLKEGLKEQPQRSRDGI